jgi:hypothetical protein
MISKNSFFYQAHKKVKESISARKKIIIWQLTGKPVPAPHIVKQNIIKGYATTFKLKIFIETGTYVGEMLDAMLNIFPEIISIEFDQALAERAKYKYVDHPHVTIMQGDSGSILPIVIAGKNEPCLFWLDAHYSGGFTGKSDLDTPIMKEINAILEHPCDGHVILIDDAREFTGKNHYPTLEEVRSLVTAKRKGWLMEVDADIIRIHEAAR